MSEEPNRDKRRRVAYLSERLDRELRIFAAEESKPVSTLVARAIREMLQRERPGQVIAE